MAELKPTEVIMRIDFVASDGEQICAHAEWVQELIRCKDCAYYDSDWCNVWSNTTRYDGYCHESEPYKGE